MSSSDKNGTGGKEVFTLPLVKDGPLHGPETARPTEADEAHVHAHHGGPDHVPHVLPMWVYFATWGALMVLTAITVFASYLDLGAMNLVIALFIATTKACIVALMFMHLKYDHKFHAIIFSFSVIFLGIFIAFTMFDTETRGQADQVQADRPVNIKAPFQGTALNGKQEMMRKKQLGLPPDQPLQPATLAPPQ
jgi:cytochrome c oxidase subunit 4